MSNTVENRLHFGVPIFEAWLPDFADKQEELLKLILDLRHQDQGVNCSNQGGWHSEETLFQHEHPMLQWLTQSVYNVGSQCIAHAEGDRLTGKVLMTSMWANVNDFGAWNAPHVHLPCEWAGCVYISVNENPQQRGVGARDGDIIFFDPMPAGPQYGRPPTVSYAPKNGTMFIFPGYLLHMVAPHYEQDPRVSVAFNFRLSDQLEGFAR